MGRPSFPLVFAGREPDNSHMENALFFSMQSAKRPKEKSIMKWMKWFLVMMVGLAVGLGMVGCSSDDDGNDDPLVGTWSATSFNGQPMPANTSVTVTFRDDGTAQGTTTFGAETDSFSGTWSAANGIITIVDEDGAENTPYSISGNTLTITDPEGSFTLTRK